MISKFKNLTEFISLFSYEETYQKYFETIRFKNGDYCPHCGYGKILRFLNGKRYCRIKCKKYFAIKTGTILGESKIPPQKWFVAIQT